MLRRWVLCGDPLEPYSNGGVRNQGCCWPYEEEGPRRRGSQTNRNCRIKRWPQQWIIMSRCYRNGHENSSIISSVRCAQNLRRPRSRTVCMFSISLYYYFKMIILIVTTIPHTRFPIFFGSIQYWYRSCTNVTTVWIWICHDHHARHFVWRRRFERCQGTMEDSD